MRSRSPCVAANLDAVVSHGKVIAVPGQERAGQGGECLGQHRWGDKRCTRNLQVGFPCEECARDESNYLGGWMAARNEVRTFIPDDAEKLNIIRDRCERKPLFLLVDPVLIPYVQTDD